MDKELLNQYRRARRSYPHYKASTCLGIARGVIALRSQKRTLWDGDTIPGTDGCTLRIAIDYDDCDNKPWEQCDSLGEPEYQRGIERERPPSGYRYLEGDRWGAWVYPFADAMAKARREFANHSRYPEQDARRVVEWEADCFSRWLAEYWWYMVVTVEAIDENGRVVASDSLGGVESDYAESAILDHDMIASVCEQAREARPVAEFEYLDNGVE